MKATNLRIGNLVNRTLSGSETIIDKITGYDLWHSEKLHDVNHRVEWNAISEIELTDEWLIRFGFVIDDEQCFHKNGIMLDKRYTGDNTYEFEFYSSCVNIIFVHQLQNLYHALTNEELCLNQRTV